MIKEETVKKAGKDDIAIECISARLLKARTFIEPYFVTFFMIAYAPTEEAAGGQKAKYEAALKSTVASVPAWKYVFVLINVNARTGKKSEEGGETDSTVLGVCDRDVLNENGKLLLGFTDDNKLALMNTFFCTHPQKWRFLHFAKRQPQLMTTTSGLFTDEADGPPIRPLG